MWKSFLLTAGRCGFLPATWRTLPSPCYLPWLYFESGKRRLDCWASAHTRPLRNRSGKPSESFSSFWSRPNERERVLSVTERRVRQIHFSTTAAFEPISWITPWIAIPSSTESLHRVLEFRSSLRD